MNLPLQKPKSGMSVKMILPPTRKGARKTWVNAGLSASGIELTRGSAQGGLVAFNFGSKPDLLSGE